MKTVDFYRAQKLVIVGYDFQSEGGAWRSIYRYFRQAEEEGKKILLIDRRKEGTFRRLLCAVLFSRKILFNGLGTFYRWEGVIACLLRRDIMLYLHDTQYMVDRYSRQQPWKYRLFKMILKRNTILCVSEQMQTFYREDFGVARSHVVREAVALPPAVSFDAAFRHIVMVGSLDERKGVPLFSEVATLAHQRSLPWKFHWVGALASQNLGKLSPLVRWWGWQDSPWLFVSQADLFFLSSVDDPLPLACLEAMALGKRCVVYRQTGIAEMIAGIRGCAVFEKYSAEEAFRALQSALSDPPDSGRLQQLTQATASVQALAGKIEAIAEF